MSPASPTPGLYEQILALPAGGEMPYTVAIPKGYTPDHPTPFVLALHYGWGWGGPPPPYYGRGLLIGLVRPALAELGAIIAAPDCPGPDWAKPESEAALMALLEHCDKTYSLNRDRMLLTGYSLGGIGTWYLAGRHPGLFAAAIPMASVPHEESVDLIEDLSLYVIHSRQDELMPLGQTEAAVRRLEARGIAVELVVVEGIPHFETFRFQPHLREAVPWIRKVWARGGK